MKISPFLSSHKQADNQGIMSRYTLTYRLTLSLSLDIDNVYTLSHR